MALKKKPAVKSRTLNKGLEAGQKDAFTPAQVKRIRHVLADRGVPGIRDLALFSLAIDTMLQGPELRQRQRGGARHVCGRKREAAQRRGAALEKRRAACPARSEGANWLGDFAMRYSARHWSESEAAQSTEATGLAMSGLLPRLT